MKLRHGENNNVVDADYLHVRLKTILEKEKIDKKFLYKVEWMDGTIDWVLEKKILHESEILNEFESKWWKDKRKKEKEGNNVEKDINIVKEEVLLKEEEKYIGNMIEGKTLARLKGKKINIYDNLSNDMLNNNIMKNNNSSEDLNKMNEEKSNVTINIKVEPKENIDEESSSLEKPEINTFNINKILKPSYKSPSKKKKLKNNLSIKNPRLMGKSKNQNVNIEQILLNNKRERVEEDLNFNNNEVIKINYPTIKIIDYEDIIEVEYLVEWKQREDGTIPTVSFISEKTAQENYSNLLIDFLSKTLRDKNIKNLEFPLN